VVRLDAQLLLDRVHKSAKHVHQHALTVLLDDVQHFHVDQRGEHQRLAALHFAGVVDLAHGLVRLVDGVDEGQPHMAGFHVELGQDGVAKSFGGDAGPVGDKKYGAKGHVCKKYQNGRGRGAPTMKPLSTAPCAPHSNNHKA